MPYQRRRRRDGSPLFRVGRSDGRAICPISDGCIHRGRGARSKKSAVGCAGALLPPCFLPASPMNLSFVFAALPLLPLLWSFPHPNLGRWATSTITISSLRVLPSYTNARQEQRETVGQVGDVRRITTAALVCVGCSGQHPNEGSLSRATAASKMGSSAV